MAWSDKGTWGQNRIKVRMLGKARWKYTLTFRTNTDLHSVVGHLMFHILTELPLYLMTSRGADPASVLLFFYLYPLPPLSIQPFIKAVNELLMELKQNWIICDRCVLTHIHTEPFNIFTYNFSLVCPCVSSLCVLSLLSHCPNSISLSICSILIFVFLLFLGLVFELSLSKYFSLFFPPHS